MKRVLLGPDGKISCPRCKGNIYHGPDGLACLMCGQQDLRLPRGYAVPTPEQQLQRIRRGRQQARDTAQHRREVYDGVASASGGPPSMESLMTCNERKRGRKASLATEGSIRLWRTSRRPVAAAAIAMRATPIDMA